MVQSASCTSRLNAPRSKMPNHFLLLGVVLFVTCACSGFLGTGAQGPVLTMMLGEQCFGSRVDLLCTHPDPLADPVKYLGIPITWAENGTVIDLSDPVHARLTPTRVNSTASTLSLDITEEDHRDRVILCSCFLVRNDANRDRDESNTLVVDPPEKASAPVVQSMPTNTSNVMRWTPGPGCYRHHTFTFSLTWTYTNTSVSGCDITTATQYDFSGLPRGEYSVSIQGWCNEDPSIESNMASVLITLTAPVGSPLRNITTPSTKHPTPPTLRGPITTTPSTITLEVDHRNTCFENCTFQYEVKVHPAGSHMSISTTTHSTNVFNVSGLSGGTRYRAEIVAVCVEESTIRSDPLNVNFTTRMEDGPTVTPTTPPDNGTDTTASSTPDTITVTLSTGLIAGIVVVCVVVYLLTFLAGCGVGVIGHVVYQKFKQSTGSGEVVDCKENSSTSLGFSKYVNVEMDDRSVPLTTNLG